VNEAFKNVIGASDEDRRGLFLTAATRMGTAVQNVEKDFWVCWTLDAMFNGLAAGGPRLLFKGGTSLSKAFGLISRFSEDIDITVFREDLGQPIEAAQLDGLSGKQRRLRLEEIRQACEAYIMGAFQTQITDIAKGALPEGKFKVEPDPDDADHQTLLFWYPAVTAAPGDYIRAAVKIEAGAKSALDPHVQTSVRPFVSEDVPDLDLTVGNITTVSPERTFWDKVVILHGLRQWFERRGVLRHEGQRVSRHYYDVHRLVEEATARGWTQDQGLANDCATHARLFFGSPDLGLDTAKARSFTLMPADAMREALARDYQAMAGMIFGQAPELNEVLNSVQQLENFLNAPPAGEEPV
jgi:hypothetical protein